MAAAGTVTANLDVEAGWRAIVDVARQRPLALVAPLGLTLALVMFMIEFPHLVDLGNPLGALLAVAWYQAWTVLVLMLLSMKVRTVRLRHVVRAWLFGFFASAGIVALFGAVITAILPPGPFRTAGAVPLLEEVVKLAPIVLLVVTARLFGRDREHAVSDLVILGFAVGGGYAFHENALWVREIAAGFSGDLWGLLFPSFPGTTIVPEALIGGHKAWTMLAALGFGLTWHLRRHGWAWIIAPSALVIAIADHAGINFRNFDASSFWTRATSGIAADGYLVAWLLVAGVVVALALDAHAVRTVSRPVRPSFRALGSRVRRVRGPIAQLLVMTAIIGHFRDVNARRLAAFRANATPSVHADQPPAPLAGTPMPDAPAPG